MLDIKDIHWLAGLVEGEGCFSTTGSNGTDAIMVWMTDRDVIEHAREVMRCTTKIAVRPPRRGRDGIARKELYGAVAYGPLAAQWAMTLYPLLGKRRREAARRLIERWHVRPGSGNWRKAA